ncbi:hypothetical protein CCP3SC15_1310003 [Gammaproteobacteria bacterium]
MIIIYVDGEQVLAPIECIYVPSFEFEDKRIATKEDEENRGV